MVRTFLYVHFTGKHKKIKLNVFHANNAERARGVPAPLRTLPQKTRRKKKREKRRKFLIKFC